MSIANLLKRCHTDIWNYRKYLSRFPGEFVPAIEKSPLNLEEKYLHILQEMLPLELWKELMWINWEFPTTDYESIDDFIIKNKIED